MRRFLALLLALFLVLLSGCAAGEEEGIRIYYAAANGTDYGQSALDDEVWEDAPESPTPDDLFLRMTAAPGSDDRRVIFPKATQLLSWSLEDGLLTLNFSERYGDLSGIALTQANYCLALTMTQLEGVEQITILVEEDPLPYWGNVTLSADDILLTGEIEDPTLMGFRLYFPRSDRSGLDEDYQETEVYGLSAEEQFRAVIQLLVSGPTDSDEMSSPFVGLEGYLELDWVDGVCVVELTDSWAQVLISDELALRSLVNSLCACDDIDAVAFSREGGSAATLEGTFYSDYET